MGGTAGLVGASMHLGRLWHIPHLRTGLARPSSLAKMISSAGTTRLDVALEAILSPTSDDTGSRPQPCSMSLTSQTSSLRSMPAHSSSSSISLAIARGASKAATACP